MPSITVVTYSPVTAGCVWSDSEWPCYTRWQDLTGFIGSVYHLKVKIQLLFTWVLSGRSVQNKVVPQLVHTMHRHCKGFQDTPLVTSPGTPVVEHGSMHTTFIPYIPSCYRCVSITKVATLHDLPEAVYINTAYFKIGQKLGAENRQLPALFLRDLQVDPSDCNSNHPLIPVNYCK